MIKAKSFVAGESELSRAGKTDLYRPLAKPTRTKDWPLLAGSWGPAINKIFIYTLIFILLRFFKVLLFYDPQHPNTLNDRTLLIFTGL